jgi:hypothetical protein
MSLPDTADMDHIAPAPWFSCTYQACPSQCIIKSLVNSRDLSVKDPAAQTSLLDRAATALRVPF